MLHGIVGIFHGITLAVITIQASAIQLTPYVTATTWPILVSCLTTLAKLILTISSWVISQLWLCPCPLVVWCWQRLLTLWQGKSNIFWFHYDYMLLPRPKTGVNYLHRSIEMQRNSWLALAQASFLGLVDLGDHVSSELCEVFGAVIHLLWSFFWVSTG